MEHVTVGTGAQVQQPDSHWHLIKSNFKQKQMNELWSNSPVCIEYQINQIFEGMKTVVIKSRFKHYGSINDH